MPQALEAEFVFAGLHFSSLQLIFTGIGQQGPGDFGTSLRGLIILRLRWLRCLLVDSQALAVCLKAWLGIDVAVPNGILEVLNPGLSVVDRAGEVKEKQVRIIIPSCEWRFSKGTMVCWVVYRFG